MQPLLIGWSPALLAHNSSSLSWAQSAGSAREAEADAEGIREESSGPATVMRLPPELRTLYADEQGDGMT